MASPISVTRVRAYEGHAAALYTVVGLGQELGSYRFATAGSEGIVADWRTAEPALAHALLQTPQPIYSLALLPWNQLLAVGQGDGGIHVVDVATGTLTRSASVHTGGVFDLLAVPASRTLIAAGGDGQLSIWQGEPLTCQLTARISATPLRALALSSDGSLLAVGGTDRIIRLFNATTLAPVHEWPAHTHSIFALAFSPDGRTLLSAGRDAHLRAWSLPSYQLTEDLVAHLFAVHHIAYSPSGEWLATASMDKTLKLWQAPTATQPLRLLKVVDFARHGGHRSSVNRLLWLTDRELISVSDDRQVLHWRFDVR
jgi:WD40 repeat protein